MELSTVELAELLKHCGVVEQLTNHQLPVSAPARRLVVLLGGWVFVGDFSQRGTYCVLENASVIRRWGTSKGLGELAKKGPRPETILDPCEKTVRFPEKSISHMYDVEDTAWRW